MIIPIVTAPNLVLSTKSSPIEKIDSSVKKLIDDMKETLDNTKDPQGVGLAAPQVGKSLRLFIAKPTLKSSFLVFINPEIIELSETMQNLSRPKKSKSPAKLEGCLSLKNIWGTVKRNTTIILSYMDEDGKKHAKKFSGFLATIIQHETDHLNGILFPKRVLEQNGILYKSHKDSKHEDVFDEIEI